MGMGVDDESERGAKLHCGPRTWDDALGRRRHCRSNSLERICRCLAADEPLGQAGGAIHRCLILSPQTEAPRYLAVVG
jgi:hypothetical protein